MTNSTRVRRGGALAVCILCLAAAGCAERRVGPFYSSTQQAVLREAEGESATRARIEAVRVAENKARDQILLQAFNHSFTNGVTLEDATISDPFLRAKVYDTIRSAKIVDKTIQRDLGIATVTVRLDMGPIVAMLEDPEMQPDTPY